MMKRRNVEVGKIRRPMKPRKLSEGVYSSIFSYVKFLSVWGLVLLADFILDFRFEYLYPVWLLLCSVQDSYKYQGLLLTLLFVTVAIGTDIMCYMFIPVQWLFFAASSYVWVQYVWHTDRGICVSSVSLWLLFVYVEAALRLKDQKSLPFNLDLCRPFAAHCIGYPIVTLGYGLKTCAAESMRKRTVNKVTKSNDFYKQLLQEALPPELQEKSAMESEDLKDNNDSRSKDESDSASENSDTVVKSEIAAAEKTAIVSSKSYIEEYDFTAESEARELRRRNINDLSVEQENILNDSKNKVAKDAAPKRLASKRTKTTTPNSSTSASISNTSIITPTAPAQPSNGVTAIVGNGCTSPALANGDLTHKNEFVVRLEADVKRLKADLQVSRNTEQELRSQLNSKSAEERQRKGTLAQLQQDNDTLQNKLHNLVVSRQQDKQIMAELEKKLQEEKKLREKSEAQLTTERKAKKQEDQMAARAVALASANRNPDCVGHCKTKVTELEDELSRLQWDIKRKEDQIRQLESDVQTLRKYKESHTDNNEVLMSALAAMQDRNSHMENSLSAETKIKMELFSALGEAKRQVEIQCHMLAAKDKEIASLRSHITEALALVPSSMYTDQPLGGGQYTTPKLGSPTMANSSQTYMGMPEHAMYLPPSSLTSPRGYSPTSSLHSAHMQMVTGSPRGTPISGAGDNDSPGMNSALNPQAKDYHPANK